MKKYLILIAGCPATGKSYLIREIKTMLPTVFTITPDEGKEMLADAIGFHSKEEKKALEKRVWRFYYRVLDTYMEAGKQIIVSEYPFSDKQKPCLQALSELYGYQVITIRLIADFEILWQRRRDRDLYSDIHLCHIMTHYRYQDTLQDHRLADDLITKEAFKAIIEERQYNAFALGELHEFDVSDFTKVDYQPFLTALKRRIEENDKEAGA